MTTPPIEMRMEAPRKPDHLSEAEWTGDLPAGNEREGRQAIESAHELARMRQVVALL